MSHAAYLDVQVGNRDELVTRHAPLVKRIAYHLLSRLPASVEVDDLIQAGMIGLLEAASNFRAGQGAGFETYASIRIRGAMIDQMRQGAWAPRSVSASFGSWRRRSIASSPVWGARRRPRKLPRKWALISMTTTIC